MQQKGRGLRLELRGHGAPEPELLAVDGVAQGCSPLASAIRGPDGHRPVRCRVDACPPGAWTSQAPPSPMHRVRSRHRRRGRRCAWPLRSRRAPNEPTLGLGRVDAGSLGSVNRILQPIRRIGHAVDGNADRGRMLQPRATWARSPGRPDSRLRSAAREPSAPRQSVAEAISAPSPVSPLAAAR